MTGLVFSVSNLTNARLRQAIFLTFLSCLLLNSHFSRADALPAAESEELKARISEVENYIRHEGLKSVSLLPGDVRATMGWFSGNWHALETSNEEQEQEDAAAPAAKALTEPDADDDDIALPSAHFAANYHHKGFLPMHDAMMFGMNFDRSVMDDKMKFTLRPYFGQNYISMRHYYGGEISLDLDQRADGLPWGKIAIGYVKGDDAMVDHGTGIDLHGDVDLTHNWKLTTGLKQNSADGNSNYMLVRWKIDIEPQR